MNNLYQQFTELGSESRKRVHIELCSHALSKWNDYISLHGEIRYVETVCGTEQIVDSSLPSDALQSVIEGRDIANVRQRYLEPVTALQDNDLELPDSVKFAYYSIYNLFNKYMKNEAIDDWLIVNQALASETEVKLWESLLDGSLKKIHG